MSLFSQAFKWLANSIQGWLHFQENLCGPGTCPAPAKDCCQIAPLQLLPTLRSVHLHNLLHSPRTERFPATFITFRAYVTPDVTGPH